MFTCLQWPAQGTLNCTPLHLFAVSQPSAAEAAMHTAPSSSSLSGLHLHSSKLTSI